MWQVAVYNRRQHEQFRADSEEFTLLANGAGEPWRRGEGDADQPAGVLALRIRAAADSVVVDCRGMDAGFEMACGNSFSCTVPTVLSLPCIFELCDTWFEIRSEAAAAGAPGLERLDAGGSYSMAITGSAAGRGPDGETIARWLAVAGRLHRMAASSPKFFATAARLALESTGLDAVILLTRQDDQWHIAGSALPRPEHGIFIEPAALQLLVEQPAVWRRPTPTPAWNKSDRQGADQQPDSIVVAPVRDEADALVAAVYGIRHGQGNNRRRGIRTLEARVMELIADAVAVAMARRQQEIESARQRVLLEQAFSPPVAEHLQRHPEALAGQTRETTMLFADLRSFTKIAEGLCPAEAYELLAAAMEMLTQAIMDHGGVVIDYYGDGVSALWNAPLDVPDHADRACAAALQMLVGLPEVSRDWRRLLPEPLQLGIGIHTGTVQVGNAGTRQRLKYGPRGSAVNVASRVQAAAKRLDVALLATDAVRRRLSSQFVTLKVCTARLPGLEEPLELFTVFPSTDAPRLQDDLDQYAAALEAFESGDLEAAERQLSQLLAAGPATPAAFLAQQTAALRQGALGRRATDEFGCTPDAVIEILAK